MSSEILMPLFAIAIFLFICYLLFRFARSLRRGGGSATNFMIGTTELFRTTEQNKAAEIILEQKSGTRLEEQEDGDTND
jgi:hypothetical protein